jgi:hypothetical protein
MRAGCRGTHPGATRVCAAASRPGIQGETIRIHNFELWYAPRHREVPMYLSAVFPKGVAEVADGPTRHGR